MKKEKVFMEGYKGFNKDLKCRDKQYYENSIAEEDEAKICNKGIHFCKDPVEVLNYYPLLDDDCNLNEFRKIEALDECFTDDNKKFVTKKIKLGSKLSFVDLIKLSVDFDYENIIENCNSENNDEDFAKIGSSGNSVQIGSSGDFAQIGSSGNSAQIGSLGNFAQIGSSGNSAQIGSSGNFAQIGSSGNYAKVGSSGNFAQIGSLGNFAKIGSSGDFAQIGSSGDYAQIGSSGDYAQIGSLGNFAKIGSSGNFAQIGSSGNSAKVGSSGNSAQIGSLGNFAQIGSSGDYAQINSTGKYSVIMCAGNNSKAKGKIGSWITLSEWKNDDGIWKPKCVKTKYIDGTRIKEDTWYYLKNGEFVEYE